MKLDETDARARSVCRYVLHYYQKNGYLPSASQPTIEPELDRLVADGVLKRVSLYDGGPLILVALTDKGARMAEER